MSESQKDTSNTNFLSRVFEDDYEDLDRMTEKFLTKLQGCIAKNFKKIRVNGHKD